MSRYRPSKIEEKIAYEIFRSCRLCGAGAGYKMPIVQNVDLDGDVPLTQKIRDCVQIEVHQEDKMPPLICELCVDKVNDFYEFSEMCKQTNMKTRLRLGLPPQTMPRGAPDAGDCILGVTETIFANEDSNEPIIKHKQGKQNKSKKETSDKVKIKTLENNRNTKSIKSSPDDNRRATRGSFNSPTNILTLRNRNCKDQKNVDQLKKTTSEPLKSILKKEKIKEEILEAPKSKRGRERESKPELPVKRVKIEVSASTSKSRRSRSPIRSRKSPPKAKTKSPPTVKTRSPPRPRIQSPETNVCRVCKRSFLTKSSLTNHVKTHQDTKNWKNKRSPPIVESRTKDRMDKIQAKDKGVTNKHKDTHKCSCGREYSAIGNLRRHQVTCRGKKEDVTIDPKLMSKVRPLQVRVARCDPLLTENTCIFDIPQVFGLDKNCIYPYLKTMKVEPKTGRDGMVRIADEIKDVFDDTHYIHWDSDSESDDYEPFIKKMKVLTLSTLSLKTIFSPRYLGRVRRKRRKVNTEIIPENTQSKDMFDDIESFDDVHDLERLNDCCFDQLFNNDYQKISVPDVEDLNRENVTEDLNKDISCDTDSLKEGNGDDKDISNNQNSDKDVSKEDSDKDVNTEENSDTNVRKEENCAKDLSKEDNGAKDVSKEDNGAKDVNKEENSEKDVRTQNSENIVSKEESSDVNVSKEEGSGKDVSKENSEKCVSLNKEESSSDKENGSLNEENDRDKDVSAEEENNIDKDVSTNKEENVNKKDSCLKNGENIDKTGDSSLEGECNKTEDKLNEEVNISCKDGNIEELREREVKDRLDASKIESSVANGLNDIKESNIDCLVKELTENQVNIGVEDTIQKTDLDQICLEIKNDSEIKNFTTDVEKDLININSDTIQENVNKILMTDENQKLNKDTIKYGFLQNKEDMITENDLLGERNFNYTEVSRDSMEFEEKINENTDKNEELIQNDAENVADDIMKNILNKVKESDSNTNFLVNGDKNDDDSVMDDQRLMDELDAQIGEDIMEKHMSLDDFSEDEGF